MSTSRSAATCCGRRAATSRRRGWSSGSGPPEFTQRSIELYGAPRDRIGPNAVTNLEAAELFLALTDDFPVVGEQPDDVCLRPEYVAEQLRERIAPVFVDHPIAVDIDAEMASKAAAGARRVRIRGGTCFSQQDIASWRSTRCSCTASRRSTGASSRCCAAWGSGRRGRRRPRRAWRPSPS
jgi:hypothetical protein